MMLFVVRKEPKTFPFDFQIIISIFFLYTLKSIKNDIIFQNIKNTINSQQFSSQKPLIFSFRPFLPLHHPPFPLSFAPPLILLVISSSFIFQYNYYTLLIPSETSMNSDYLKKPILTKKIEYRCCSGLAYTSSQMQGWRRTMQDAIICQQLSESVYMFAVLDGHGGPQVAHYVSQVLPKQILNQPYFKLKNYPKALTNVFKRIDTLLESARGQEDLQVISKRLGVTSSKVQKISYRAGTTAVVLLVTKERYYVANIGDSRAVLSRNDTAIPLSYDHKPEVPTQKNRIEKAGGYVKLGRVNGTLSLSRSFGDFQYKHFSNRPYEQQAVISLPQVIEMDRSPDDNFIILGCDGVWQRYVSNSQKMVSHIKQLRDKNNDKKAVMEKLFGDLIAKDMKEGNGCDNMSAILVQLF